MKKISFSLIIAFLSISSFSQEKQEFKPSGKLWGYAFGDYYYKIHSDSLKRGSGEYSGLKENANAFEFRRIYLGYDYTISEKFSAELLLSHEKNYDANSNRTVLIKSANVRWKNFYRKNDLVIGQSATPTWSLTEKIWAYRSVEKTIIDKYKAGNSNDLGVAIQGKLDSTGNIGYNLMAGNGTATKIESDRFKKFYGEIYFWLLKKKIMIDLYADYEKIQLNPYHKSKTSIKLFTAYTTPNITLGIEVYQQAQQNFSIFSDTLTGNSDTAYASVFGAGIFARGSIIKEKLAYYVRTDIYDPNSNFNNEYVYSGGYSAYNNEVFSVLGLDYTPVKNVHIMPNVWLNTYASKKKNTAGMEKADYDLVPRITVYYIFK